MNAVKRKKVNDIIRKIKELNEKEPEIMSSIRGIYKYHDDIRNKNNQKFLIVDFDSYYYGKFKISLVYIEDEQINLLYYNAKYNIFTNEIHISGFTMPSINKTDFFKKNKYMHILSSDPEIIFEVLRKLNKK